MAVKNDFSKGPVWRCIVTQAIPLTIAELVHLLYNVVDRIYIGHMESADNLALTGIGLTFPIVTLIAAFAALFGNGGVPLFSMARGENDPDKAGKILGNSFGLLLLSSLVLTAVCYLFRRPILFAFGASEDSFVYANAYLRIYLIGTPFTMISTGMNGYINAQGFPRTGMLSIIIGAAANLILDPIFIFALDMGVEGAALATIISQILSAAWVMWFLPGKKAIVPLRRENVVIDRQITKNILTLGTANFIAKGTTGLVQVVCNATLQNFGGDLYVGIMTVINSVREVVMLPVSGIFHGAQPVISFNYGAGEYKRVKTGVSFNTVIGSAYTLIAWLLVFLFPRFWIGIFSDDVQMIEAGIGMLRIYFFGFVFMALQFAGQTTFQALGRAKQAICFSMLRKVIIVIPLTLLLPRLGFGVAGVFLAEPVSNVLGGMACYVTMRLTVYRQMSRSEKSP